VTDLVPIGGGHRLAPAPAAAYLRAHAAGCPGGITSSYRDPDEQRRLRALYLAGQYPAYVAPVEKSEHVLGNALDLPAEARAWMREHPEHGFVFTDRTEDWHVAYRIVCDRCAGQPVPIPKHVEEDVTMIALARLKDMYHDGRVYVGDGVTRTHVTSERDLRDKQSMIRLGVLKAKTDQVHVVDSLGWLGKEI